MTLEQRVEALEKEAADIKMATRDSRREQKAAYNQTATYEAGMLLVVN
jgi:hypothetical protein